MKKIILTSALIGTAYGISNAVAADSAKEIMKEWQGTSTPAFRTLEPTYIENGMATGWKDNWFLSIQGGGNAFLGSPKGCGDLFGRMKPAVQISLGKWHTPSIGNRFVFQGFDWKASDMAAQNYRHWHADFLYNLSPALGFGNGNGRFDLIPLVGIGFIDNTTLKRNPFAINYGVQGRFKLSDAWHITAEFGHAITTKDADGYGSSRQFGDNLLSLTAGVSWTFGAKKGFKRVVDARPYVIQNEELMANAFGQQQRIDQLQGELDACAAMNDELRKILEIEGLLDHYLASLGWNKAKPCKGESHGNVVDQNDYSGLNSLRQRLNPDAGKEVEKAAKTSRRNRKIKGNNACAMCDMANGTTGHDLCDALASGKEHIGAPICFFFNLGTAQLVDKSQAANMAEIARVAKKHSLYVVIEGAADAATGNAEINYGLGNERAEFIARELKRHGVSPDRYRAVGIGGIFTFSPQEANRNAIVKLYLKSPFGE